VANGAPCLHAVSERASAVWTPPAQGNCLREIVAHARHSQIIDLCIEASAARQQLPTRERALSLLELLLRQWEGAAAAQLLRRQARGTLGELLTTVIGAVASTICPCMRQFDWNSPV
jgi:hypothetical protein